MIEEGRSDEDFPSGGTYAHLCTECLEDCYFKYDDVPVCLKKIEHCECCYERNIIGINVALCDSHYNSFIVEESDEEEAPTEEELTPTEEEPDEEEATTSGASTSEGEVVPEELPTEEVVPEELPTEEVVPEELPTEEVVPEELPTE
jgi:hypothetical protein